MYSGVPHSAPYISSFQCNTQYTAPGFELTTPQLRIHKMSLKYNKLQRYMHSSQKSRWGLLQGVHLTVILPNIQLIRIFTFTHSSINFWVGVNSHSVLSMHKLTDLQKNSEKYAMATLFGGQAFSIFQVVRILLNLVS